MLPSPHYGPHHLHTGGHSTSPGLGVHKILDTGPILQNPLPGALIQAGQVLKGSPILHTPGQATER